MLDINHAGVRWLDTHGVAMADTRHVEGYYRYDLYQELFDGVCNSDGDECACGRRNNNYPVMVTGLEWTAEDDEAWLKSGHPYGEPQRYERYIAEAHLTAKERARVIANAETDAYYEQRIRTTQARVQAEPRPNPAFLNRADYYAPGGILTGHRADRYIYDEIHEWTGSGESNSVLP